MAAESGFYWISGEETERERVKKWKGVNRFQKRSGGVKCSKFCDDGYQRGSSNVSLLLPADEGWGC